MAGKASEVREGGRVETLTFHMKGQTSNKNMICTKQAIPSARKGKLGKVDISMFALT